MLAWRYINRAEYESLKRGLRLEAASCEVRRAADLAEDMFRNGWEWAGIIEAVAARYSAPWELVQSEIARRHKMRTEGTF